MTTKEYLEKKMDKNIDDKFIAFDYAYGKTEQDLPVFIRDAKDGDDTNLAGRGVYAYTPAQLCNYVNNLTEEAKLNEMNNLDEFVGKCNRMAKYSIANGLSDQKSWDKAINNCVDELEYNNNAEMQN